MALNVLSASRVAATCLRNAASEMRKGGIVVLGGMGIKLENELECLADRRSFKCHFKREMATQKNRTYHVPLAKTPWR